MKFVKSEEYSRQDSTGLIVTGIVNVVGRI